MKAKIFVAALIAVIVSSILFIIHKGKNEPLPVYVPYATPTATMTPTPTPLQTEMQTLHESSLNYTLEIPSAWTFASDDDKTMYVHAATGATLSIQSGPYVPYLSQCTPDSTSKEVSAAGGELINFQRIGNNEYRTSYTLVKERSYTFDELTLYNREKYIRLSFVAQTNHYDAYRAIVKHIYDSFEWKVDNRFPEDYRVCFNDIGSFEYAFPATWQASIEDGILYCMSESGLTLSISVVESTSTFAGTSKIAYSDFLAKSRSNLLLRDYTNDGTVIHGEASYLFNNQEYTVRQMLYANGVYEYAITFDAPKDAYEGEKENISCVLEYFRTY